MKRGGITAASFARSSDLGCKKGSNNCKIPFLALRFCVAMWTYHTFGNCRS